MIYHEKSEFLHMEFLIIQETINGNYGIRLCQNFIRAVLTKRDLMSTRSAQKMKTI